MYTAIAQSLRSQLETESVGDALEDLPSLDNGEHGELNSHNAVAHTESRLERFRDTPPGESYDGSPQRIRLPPDEIARTVTSAKGQNVHPVQDRLLTVRERARYQTFPDSFEFHGSRTERRRQTANAVPPLLAEHIARELRPLVLESE